MATLSTRVSRGTVLAALIVVGCASVAAAQTGERTDAAFARMREKLKVGDQVTVSLADGSAVKGHFTDVSADALVVATNGAARSVDAAEVTRVQRHRRGILLGSVIGAGVGIVCGALLASYAENEGGSQAGAFASMTAIGLGAGAGIDALVNLPRTVYKRPAQGAALHVDARPARPAVGFILSF